MELSNKVCWCCGDCNNITYHHAIPKAMKPLQNITIPLCEECHTVLNLFYVQSYSRGSSSTSILPAVLNKFEHRIKGKYKRDLQRVTDQLVYAQNRVKELESCTCR